MSLSIANNTASLNAQHNLHLSNMALSKSLERLSSGFKVNRGADGPAALVISEQQRTRSRGCEPPSIIRARELPWFKPAKVR